MQKLTLLATIFLLTSLHHALAASLPSESNAISAAKKSAAGQLRDPTSAQFRGVKLTYRAKDHLRICGEINGKNGCGGYVGFVNFISIIGTNASQVTTKIFPMPMPHQRNPDLEKTRNDLQTEIDANFKKSCIGE